MTPEQRRHVEDFFQRLAGLPEDAANAALERLEADIEVRNEVARLLHADAAGDPHGEVRALRSAVAEVASPDGDPAIGKHVGPYVVMSLIGEGGFGVVYLAERREPFVQRVALKIIKAGMDTRAVIARFEQERQALAVMDHPNVARVLDGGVTAPELGSRPYFVMELVQGLPMTNYCDQHRLTIRERLELFIPVCEAIQHAHHKGIIHRDIKPSNILVEVTDQHAIPKVIDFGVAKAVSHTLTEKTIFTEQGQLIGTPEYMSPEQAEMGPTGIDTRTDLYSLGVVLYELLTGALPFDRETLREAAWARIVEIIRDVDPPKPSTRLSSLGEAATAVAERRQLMGSQTLMRVLKDELDWITLKAMEKDRSRRYSTAAEFAADIRNYLAGNVVVARPPTAAYRTRKFLIRHRALVSTVVLVGTVLLGALGVSLSMLQRARNAEVQARGNAYEANIAAAGAYLAIGEASAARTRLGACSEDLRGWEWRRLSLSADGSIARAETKDMVSIAAFNADGSEVTALASSHIFRFDPTLTESRSPVSLGPGTSSFEGAEFVGLADSGRRAFFRKSGAAHWWIEGTGPAAIDLGEIGSYEGSVPAACSAFAPVAVLVAVASESRRLAIITDLRVRTIDLVRVPTRIAISDDGRTVGAAFMESAGSYSIRVWDVGALSPIEIRGMASVGDQVRDLDISAGAAVVALSGSKGIATWRATREGGQAQGFIPQIASSVAVSPDHAWVGAADGRTLRLFNLTTGDSASLRGHRESISSVVFSPDSTRVLTGGSDAVRLWRVEADTFPCGMNSITGATGAPEARRMLIFCSSPAAVELVDLATGRSREVFSGGNGLRGATMDQAGKRVAILTEESLTILDAGTSAQICRFETAKLGLDFSKPSRPRICQMAFEPGAGERLLIGAPVENKSVRVLMTDLRTGATKELSTIPQDLRCVISDGSAGVLVAGSGNRLRAWVDGLDAAPTEVDGVNSPARIAPSPDRRRIAVGTNNGTVYLAPMRGPSCTENINGHTSAATGIAWIDGGTRLVSGSVDGAVATWALDPLRTLCVENIREAGAVVGFTFDQATESLWIATANGNVRALRPLGRGRNSP